MPTPEVRGSPTPGIPKLDPLRTPGISRTPGGGPADKIVPTPTPGPAEILKPTAHSGAEKRFP
jgi:hypothetical protein